VLRCRIELVRPFTVLDEPVIARATSDPESSPGWQNLQRLTVTPILGILSEQIPKLWDSRFVVSHYQQMQDPASELN
jgi:hypothetical protein